MPRETLDIRKFNTGLVTGIEKSDVPIDAATAQSDLDNGATQGSTSGQHGLLIGRPADVTTTTTINTGCSVNGLIRNADATVDLVYVAGGNVRLCQDFLGTESDSSLGAVTNPTAVVPHNNEVRVPADTPKWVGDITFQQDWDGAAPGFTMEAACLTHGLGGVSAPAAATAAAGALIAGKSYIWRVAFEYDGYQLSYLNRLESYSETIDRDTGTGAVKVKLWLLVSTVVKRLTAVHLFRQEIDYNDNVYTEGTAYFVKRISLANGTGWALSADTLRYEIDTVDYGSQGASYEQITGISDVLVQGWGTTLSYKLAAMVGSYMVVGRCSLSTGEDFSHAIVRSKANRPDMFDWSADFLRLPTIPTAMVGFLGRLYVFDSANIYKVNVDSMAIEDSVRGVGCNSTQAIVVTEFGMFFADGNAAYWHDGQTLHQISETISPSWRSWASGRTIVASFHVESHSVVFTKPGSTSTAYVYNLNAKRWDYWTFSKYNNAYPIVGENGELYIASSSDVDVIQVAASTSTRKSWSWTSATLDLDDPSQTKKFYIVRTNGTGSPTVTYSLDGATFVSAPIATGGVAGKTIQIKVTGGAAVDVSHVSLVYRKMIGKR